MGVIIGHLGTYHQIYCHFPPCNDSELLIQSELMAKPSLPVPRLISSTPYMVLLHDPLPFLDPSSRALVTCYVVCGLIRYCRIHMIDLFSYLVLLFWTYSLGTHRGISVRFCPFFNRRSTWWYHYVSRNYTLFSSLTGVTPRKLLQFSNPSGWILTILVPYGWPCWVYLSSWFGLLSVFGCTPVEVCFAERSLPTPKCLA